MNALRANGINARSVDEIFGIDPGDELIKQAAEQMGAEVVTKDRGTDINGGFGALANKNISNGLRRLPENDAPRILKYLKSTLRK